MRARRRSRGRREPMYWSRVCAMTSGSQTGPDDLGGECDNSEAKFGVVLVDAGSIASQGLSTVADTRITIRRILWPTQVNAIPFTAGTPNGFMWCVVLKGTGDQVSNIVGNFDLTNILTGGFDVLDVRLWKLGQDFSGGTNVHFQGGPSIDQPTFDIRAQRKLDMQDQIAAIFGFFFFDDLAATQGWLARVSTLVSVLWQRTLR